MQPPCSLAQLSGPVYPPGYHHISPNIIWLGTFELMMFRNFQLWWDMYSNHWRVALEKWWWQRKTIHYFPIGFFCSLFVGELPSFKVEQMCPPKHFRKRSPPTDGTDRDLNIGAFQKFGSLIFRAEKLYWESQFFFHPWNLKHPNFQNGWLSIGWWTKSLLNGNGWNSPFSIHDLINCCLRGTGTQMTLPFWWSLDPSFGGPPTFKNKGPWGFLCCI